MRAPRSSRCEWALEALSARIDDELSSFESTALEAHLASCPRCAAVEQPYEAYSRRLRVHAAKVVPDLRRQILSRSLRPLSLRRDLPRLLLGAVVGLAAFCGALLAIDHDGAPDVEVAEAEVISAGPGQDTAVYLTLVNHGGGDELTGVRADVAEQAVLHFHDARSGEIVMAASGSHPVEARAATTLGPGEKHVMLEGLRQDLAAGDEVTLTLQFANSDDTTVTLDVVAASLPLRTGGPNT